MRFRSYVDGQRAVPRPRDLDGGPGRARLRHRARVRRVHAVSRLARLHRPLDGAHPPLARPLPGLARAQRPGRPGRVRDRPGRGRARPAGDLGRDGAPPARATGSPSAGRSGRDKAQMYEVVALDDRRARAARPRPPAPSAGDRRGRRPDRGRRCWGSTRFDCAMPTRLGRHGVALVPDPGARWRVDLVKSALAALAGADPRGVPVPGLRGRASRAPTCTTCCEPAS